MCYLDEYAPSAGTERSAVTVEVMSKSENLVRDSNIRIYIFKTCIIYIYIFFFGRKSEFDVRVKRSFCSVWVDNYTIAQLVEHR